MPVEDGKPFCLQCGAPQIRVPVPEEFVSIPENLPVDELPAIALDRSATAGFHRGGISALIDWRRAFRLCVVSALVSVGMMSVRVIGPLIAVFAAGFLAVALYYRGRPSFTANAPSGAKIGALTGVLSSGISAIFFGIFIAIMQAGGDLRREMLDRLQQLASRSNDPQVQATFDLLKTPEGLTKLVLGMMGFFLISIAAGALAGALTGAALGRRNRL